MSHELHVSSWHIARTPHLFRTTYLVGRDDIPSVCVCVCVCGVSEHTLKGTC